MSVLDSLSVVLKMTTADFVGPAQEAGETIKSSGSLIQAAGTQIKSAVGEAFNGSPLSEFGILWQEVKSEVTEAAAGVEQAATSAGNATKSALSSTGGNQLATSMQQASAAAKEFAAVMTQALDQIKGELNIGDGAGLEALDTELQTTAADAQSAAAEIATAMQSIDTDLQQTGTIAQASGAEVAQAMAEITSGIEGATTAGASLSTLNGELAATGTSAEAAGASSVASGAAMGGAFALAPQIALITGLTMALSKVPEAIDSVTEAGKGYDEAVQTITQTTGMSTAAASTLLDTFQHFGTPIAQANKDLDQMSKNAVTAAQGNNEQAKAFQDLGVSVTNTDGSLKSANEIFSETGGALAAMADGVNKNNDEMVIFGRSGTDLNEMFQSNIAVTATATQKAQAWGDSIAGIQQQALATGHYLSEEGYSSFEKYQEATRNSSDALATLKEKLGNDLIPVMTDFDNGTATAATWIDEKLIPALGKGADDFKELWTDIKPIRDVMSDLVDAGIGPLQGALESLNSLLTGPFGGTIKVLAAVTLVGLLAAFVAIAAPIVAIGVAIKGTEVLLDDFGQLAVKVTGYFSDARKWLEGAGENIINGLIDGVENKVDDLLNDIEDIGGDIVSAIESALGINSPSTEGIRIGANFGGAVALGVQQSHPLVAAAVTGLGQLMASSGQSSAASASAQMVRSVGPTSSQPSPQTVVIHNYMGTKAIETVVGTAVNGVFRQQSRIQN